MGTPLTNPPVCFTICQVRFNTLLKLSEFLPGIQEHFRLAGYPSYENQSNLIFQMTAQPGNSEQIQPIPISHESYLFGNIEKNELFILDSQSLTLQSTHYDCFDSFSKTFLDGLSTIDKTVNLAFFDRIGLRYLDKIMPNEGESLAQYLYPEVLGLSSRLGGSPIFSYSETMSMVDEIKLRVRVITQEGGLSFPPDVQIGNMAIENRFLEYRGKSAMIDNDGFIEHREAFSIEAIKTHMNSIHGRVESAFTATATEHAFSSWMK